MLEENLTIDFGVGSVLFNGLVGDTVSALPDSQALAFGNGDMIDDLGNVLFTGIGSVEVREFFDASSIRFDGLFNPFGPTPGTLTIRDNGILDALFKMAAQEQGKTRDELVTEALGAMQGQIGDEILQPISNFLLNGGQLKVSMAPQNPTPAMQLMMTAGMAGDNAPAAIMNALNITISN